MIHENIGLDVSFYVEYYKSVLRERLSTIQRTSSENVGEECRLFSLEPPGPLYRTRRPEQSLRTPVVTGSDLSLRVC